jgi:hypothetical protein
MALKGNLKDFSLTQLLNLVNLARKTGALQLTHAPASSARLFFREGKLIDAGLDGQAHELTTLLYRFGKLSADQQKTILSQASVRTDKELALLLINANYVNQTDIVQAVRSHLLDTVYLLFTWNDGTFFFEPAVLPAEERITIPIHLEGVIMEGTRRVQEWEMLQDELPDLDLAMKFSERPNTNLRDIHLSVDEWRVISWINPRNSIKQIADQNKMNDFQVRKIVYRMMQAGLVELMHAEGAAPKRLLTRPPAPAVTTARAPSAATPAPSAPAASVPAPSVQQPALATATAAGPAAPAQPAGAAPPSRNIIMRIINRIRQL